MKFLAAFLVLSFSLAAWTSTEFVTVRPGSKGVYLYFPRSSDYSYSVYRGTIPGEYELVATNVKPPYLDTTAEADTQYYYKIVAETRDYEVTTYPAADYVFLRDFRVGEHVGSPASRPGSSYDEFEGSHFYHNLVEQGAGFGVNRGTSSYNRFLNNLVTGQKYIARIYFGGIYGNCVRARISLSKSRPVADVVVPGSVLNTYARQVKEFELTGGPKGWGEFSFTIQGHTPTCNLFIHRIELIKK